MKRIFLKSGLVAMFSTVASLLLVVTLVPAFGGVVDGSAWLMCTLCPLVIAWPSSAHLFWQKERLKRAHEELVAAHAELAAAHRKLAEKASRDDMTGMLNRESFFARLDAARRNGDRGALLIIDADHFKDINDNYGHLTGDRALLEIVAAIGRGVRGGDILGRIGGEEFAVFLPGATEKEALRVAERIRREVELIRFRPMEGRTLPLTVSIGGTTCQPGAAVSELMRTADKRLYEAKRHGRNRAILEPIQAAA